MAAGFILGKARLIAVGAALVAAIHVVFDIAGVVRPRVRGAGVFVGFIGFALAIAGPLYTMYNLPFWVNESWRSMPYPFPIVAGFWGSSSGRIVAEWGASAGWHLSLAAAGVLIAATLLAWSGQASLRSLGAHRFQTTPKLAARSAFDPGQAEVRRSIRRTGAGLVVLASIVHGLAILSGLLLFQALVSLTAGRDVTLGEILAALDEQGLLWAFLLGVFGQAVFLFIALVAGTQLSIVAGSEKQVVILPVGMIVFGSFAILFSFLLFGGVVGAFGGGLSIAGGAVCLGADRA